MRAELSHLHERLKTTTVYVTHDQVEAMTLGQRVAVMCPVSGKRPYSLQQVAKPTDLFNHPVNLFVAGFIGSPSMKMVYGTVTKDAETYEATFAGHSVTVDPVAIERYPGIEEYLGEEIVIGIRPGTFEDARIVIAAPDRTIRVKSDVNELLGSDHKFTSNSRPRPS